MALLLAMYQKLRLIRERNQLTLEMTQDSSKLSRIEKNIANRQKYYTSLFQKIDSQAKLLQSNATIAIQQLAGLGGMSVNPYDISYSGINTNGFIIQNAMQILANGYEYSYQKDDGTYGTDKITIKNNKFNTMYTEWTKNGGKFNPLLDEDKKTPQTTKDLKYPGYKGKDVYKYKGFDAAEADAFIGALNMAKQMQSQAQFNAQQLSAQYANNVSIWVEAQKAELELQQDMEIEPLTYEQTMLELTKTQNEARLKRIEAEIQSYDQLASKSAEEAAPKFGLG